MQLKATFGSLNAEQQSPSQLFQCAGGLKLPNSDMNVDAQQTNSDERHTFDKSEYLQ
jgi:hypothetical protein